MCAIGICPLLFEKLKAGLWNRRDWKFAKITRPFLENVISKYANKCCYHVNVMGYTLICGERKGRNEKN